MSLCFGNKSNTYVEFNSIIFSIQCRFSLLFTDKTSFYSVMIKFNLLKNSVPFQNFLENMLQ